MQFCQISSYILRSILLIVLMFFSTGTAQENQAADLLHVPSPKWENQVIYFLMIDRFNDGDSSNNDQGYGEYDPQDHRKFSGGDLQGVIDKLDYIQALGATAIWITPPNANQWWDPWVQYGGYHGYWAEHFMEVDKHFGTLETYQELSRELHKRGMYLIQDIVANHMGSFFRYNGQYNATDPSINFELNKNSVPVTVPTQFPFDLNDYNNPKHRTAAIYHWTPTIVDYNNDNQRLNYQLSGLDDLNTTNAAVRNALRKSFGYWIKKVGVDGYRIDTIIYVEHDFWHDFIHSKDKANPGINHVAAATGREDFMTFGEAYVGSDPLDDAGDRRVASYEGTPEKPEMSVALNFPLNYTIYRVIGQGNPTDWLAYRLNTAYNGDIYRNPAIMPNFIDNHDMGRFLASTSPDAFKQALFMLMTVPGMPVIYQGTEQAFTSQRQAMFAGGYGAGGKDHFDQSSEAFRFLQKLTQIRMERPELRTGELTMLQSSAVGPGIFAFKRRLGDQVSIVLLNTASHEILVSNLDAGLKGRQRLTTLASLNLPADFELVAQRGLTFKLPGRSAAILAPDGRGLRKLTYKPISIGSNFDGQVLEDDIVLEGSAPRHIGPLKVVINGRILEGTTIFPNKDGRWRQTIPIQAFPFGRSMHEITVYSEPKNHAAKESITITTQVAVSGQEAIKEDPANDDNGPRGKYLKPSDPTFGEQMDLREVKATVAGSNLMLEIETGDITDMWIPPNGFDHAVFDIFIDLPDQPGQKALPRLRSDGPEGFEWNYHFYVGGWSSIFARNDPSGESPNGIIVTPSPSVSVDKDNRRISINFDARQVGSAPLRGAKIYVTTWDGGGSEGFRRPLTLKGGPYEFGGSDNPYAPLILDDALLKIP